MVAREREEPDEVKIVKACRLASGMLAVDSCVQYSNIAVIARSCGVSGISISHAAVYTHEIPPRTRGECALVKYLVVYLA